MRPARSEHSGFEIRTEARATSLSFVMIEAFRSRPVRRQAQIDGDHVPSGIHVPMPESRMVVFSATRKTDAYAVNLLGTRAARRGITDAARVNRQLGDRNTRSLFPLGDARYHWGMHRRSRKAIFDYVGWQTFRHIETDAAYTWNFTHRIGCMRTHRLIP